MLVRGGGVERVWVCAYHGRAEGLSVNIGTEIVPPIGVSNRYRVTAASSGTHTHAGAGTGV